jgi:hypothetical protein
MSDYISEEEIFPEEILDGENVVFFFFQCKFCDTQWISTFCICPYCQRIQKFKILDSHDIMDMIASII